ncbi:type II toxin-antitoxin system HicA family toxin [Kyrpidia spormannii]|uniref:Predicted RNA binding protein YcfA, dsRBD-like fold, HicA-like mRNA interferase family n=2 Tax=Kyrpidia spormannii TaxID=2055160 RepID=A0ACA8Z803_9BACL|nr:type II toxin-antitoxin system HicA family toxin [Kyrpidia spormannii]CAB3390743.1 Predicted RNA binding protein YcfA, dsRBD-like fold, HicA-like mRNA interferase family [Kyrpidia spormannii]CAB3391656.1 Predicted RNA binding protein YcfA, dsRBD-like fold, HicA-like mRNA interferase family [Kyrpidia spormannii]
MGKQVTVREVLQRLKKEGFIPDPNHKGHGSHRRYVHKEDPTRFADISYHSSGQVSPKGTLRNIERTARMKF